MSWKLEFARVVFFLVMNRREMLGVLVGAVVLSCHPAKIELELGDSVF